MTSTIYLPRTLHTADGWQVTSQDDEQTTQRGAESLVNFDTNAPPWPRLGRWLAGLVSATPLGGGA
jgi:hypothetical protein